MNDQGLLMIQEHRAWSSLANHLYDCLDKKEKDRLFYLIEKNNVEELVLETYGSNSLSENTSIKPEVQK